MNCSGPKTTVPMLPSIRLTVGNASFASAAAPIEPACNAPEPTAPAANLVESTEPAASLAFVTELLSSAPGPTQPVGAAQDKNLPLATPSGPLENTPYFVPVPQ